MPRLRGAECAGLGDVRRRSRGGGFGSSLSPGMGHRIEVELTSQSDESTWTWRAAGAKLPRGTVSSELVPPGTAVGTVLRAEVETTLDGTTVTALLAPKGKSEPKPIERIEIIGTPQKGPTSTWSWPARASAAATTTATATATAPAARRAGVRAPRAVVAHAPMATASPAGDGPWRRRSRAATGAPRQDPARPGRADPVAHRPHRPGPSRWPRRCRWPRPGRPPPGRLDRLPQRRAGRTAPRADPGGRAADARAGSRRCARPSRSRTPGPGPKAAPK